jgi:hypothetical protein
MKTQGKGEREREKPRKAREEKGYREQQTVQERV